MFLIDPVPYQNALAQAKAQLAEQQARVGQTEREENRLRDLLETQAISQREYDNAVSESAITRAALQQAEVRVRDAELNLSYTTRRRAGKRHLRPLPILRRRAGGGQ